LQTEKVGLAIPHTDSKHVIQSAVAVATLTSPVMFKAMDNPEVEIPVTIVMMLAISDPKKVIESLTKVLSILENETAIDKIMRAATRQEIQEAFSAHIRHITEQRAANPGNSFTINH